MDGKAQGRLYEDFQPSSSWMREEGQDTVVFPLPGFKKDQLRVQLDNQGYLKISGERPLEGNRWSRFQKGFQIPENFDINAVHAKLVGGLLYVIVPKTKTQPTSKNPAAPTEQSPANKENESKTKPEKNQEETKNSFHGAPQPQRQTQTEVKNPKNSLTAEDGTKDNMESVDGKGAGRKMEADHLENMETSSKGKHAGAFGFGQRSSVSKMKPLSKRSQVVVYVAFAVVVVALGIYAAYKLRSEVEIITESLEN